MEFGVAAFSVVAGVAMSKLCTVKGKPNTDARSISADLRLIEAALRDYANEGHISFVQTEYIAQLRDLACDIEDYIDRFKAKKTSPEEFAAQLGDLKRRSEVMTSWIQMSIFTPIQGTAQGASVVANDPPDIVAAGKSRHDCLVYLYLFPPNQHVKTKPLTRRWLAEGLVDEEQFAVNNLSSIINSNYISSIQRSNNGKVKRCKPNTETLDNIAQRSLSQNFILVYDYDGNHQLPAVRPRRLSVHRPANAQLDLPKNLCRRHIRTLAVFPVAATAAPAAVTSDEAVLDFSKYEVLRVLDLKECGPLCQEHLNAICKKQVLMKYLSINLCSIHRINRDIGNLNQLETLDLSGTETVTVYKEVLLLPELKHLLGRFQLSKRDLFSVPILGLFRSKLDKFLRANSKLETLAGFVSGDRYGFPQLMNLMRRLQKVKIWLAKDTVETHLGSTSTAITKFILDGASEPQRARSLSLNVEACSTEFVNGIVPAKGYLDSLKLHGKLSQFPPFVEELSAMVELCLCSTGLSWVAIRNGLKGVRGLKFLKLVEDKLVHFDVNIPDNEAGHLRSIERISIVSSPTFNITIPDKALPLLVSLHILCQPLHVSPATAHIKINHMNSLEEITLHHQVTGAIKTGWQEAASLHPIKPVLVTEGP